MSSSSLSNYPLADQASFGRRRPDPQPNRSHVLPYTWNDWKSLGGHADHPSRNDSQWGTSWSIRPCERVSSRAPAGQRVVDGSFPQHDVQPCPSAAAAAPRDADGRTHPIFLCGGQLSSCQQHRPRPMARLRVSRPGRPGPGSRGCDQGIATWPGRFRTLAGRAQRRGRGRGPTRIASDRQDLLPEHRDARPSGPSRPDQ